MELQENKKKWIDKQGFVTFFGKGWNEKHSDQFCVQGDPSQPPMLYQFRDQQKETFLFGNFK